jgi:hypothetical protein
MFFVKKALRLSSLACLLLTGPNPAEAQSLLRLDLEVRNVDGADSCTFGSFRPELKIVNHGSAPVSLNAIDVRMFFNNPRPEPIEFVGADFVRVFNSNGSLTGQFGSVVAFESAPPDPACVVEPDRLANQTHHIAVFALDPSAGVIPPNGGFATVIVQYRRAGGLAPFDATCDDFSQLPADDRVFHDDPFFNLVEPNPMGPPTVLRCEFDSATQVDDESGIDAGVQACGASACSP